MGDQTVYSKVYPVIIEQFIHIFELLEAMSADIGLAVGQIFEVDLVEDHTFLDEVRWNPQGIELVGPTEIEVTRCVLFTIGNHKYIIINPDPLISNDN